MLVQYIDRHVHRAVSHAINEVSWRFDSWTQNHRQNFVKSILEAPYSVKCKKEFEDDIGTELQHVELSESRKKSDELDIGNFTSWLRQHRPFTKLSGELVSLSSGFVSDNSVNCINAYEMGLRTVQKMKTYNF